MTSMDLRVVVAAIAVAATVGSGCFDPDPPATADTDDATEGSATTTGTTTTATDSSDSRDESSTGPTDPSDPSMTDPSMTDPTIDPPGSTSTGEPDECMASTALDDACPSQTPYCVDGTCVDCGSLSCADVDPATPACTDEGVCVQCTADDVSGCVATQTACIDNECVPCTQADQCPSGVCIEESGECLLEQVNVTGVAYDYGTIDRTPLADVTVQITNVLDAPTAMPTGADGVYSFAGLVPGTSLDLQPLLEQDDPVFVPATLSSRMSVVVTNDEPVAFDVPVVRYAWMAQVAFECGLFATLEEAQGTMAVNPYFIQRSTVFGQLVDDDGKGVATVSRAALRAEVGEWVNFHDNLLDGDNEPAQVCFLDADEASGTYVGTTDTTSNETGRFVMFRIRNNTGLGQGQLEVGASGFDDAFTTLPSSGNIGVVELLRNDDPIPRDFAIDVYPVFSTYGCVSCHVGGGPPGAVHDGFTADWSLTPREVWDQLVGPGTDCTGVEDDPHRVCVNDPPLSLFITRPLTDAPGPPDVHPVDIFPSIDDPMVQVMLEWIEQGALPPADIDFTTDIYPLFQQHACVACHTNGGPPSAVSAGFEADWSLAPADVWENLTGPGTTCPDSDNPVRICTDDPLNSLLVTYPLTDSAGMPDDHPVNAFPSLDHPDLQLIAQWIAQGANFENSCDHNVCEPGVLLVPGCAPCVSEVCADDPFCCNNSWDNICVNQANDNPACGC